MENLTYKIQIISQLIILRPILDLGMDFMSLNLWLISAVRP